MLGSSLDMANAWWRTPLIYVLYRLRYGKNYGKDGVGGYWHDPLLLSKQLNAGDDVDVLAADVYYRYDLHHRVPTVT